MGSIERSKFFARGWPGRFWGGAGQGGPTEPPTTNHHRLARFGVRCIAEASSDERRRRDTQPRARAPSCSMFFDNFVRGSRAFALSAPHRRSLGRSGPGHRGRHPTRRRPSDSDRGAPFHCPGPAESAMSASHATVRARRSSRPQVATDSGLRLLGCGLLGFRVVFRGFGRVSVGAMGGGHRLMNGRGDWWRGLGQQR